jgi:hypothetical protein
VAGAGRLLPAETRGGGETVSILSTTTRRRLTAHPGGWGTAGAIVAVADTAVDWPTSYRRVHTRTQLGAGCCMPPRPMQRTAVVLLVLSALSTAAGGKAIGGTGGVKNTAESDTQSRNTQSIMPTIASRPAVLRP